MRPAGDVQVGECVGISNIRFIAKALKIHRAIGAFSYYHSGFVESGMDRLNAAIVAAGLTSATWVLEGRVVLFAAAAVSGLPIFAGSALGVFVGLSLGVSIVMASRKVVRKVALAVTNGVIQFFAYFTDGKTVPSVSGVLNKDRKIVGYVAASMLREVLPSDVIVVAADGRTWVSQSQLTTLVC